MRLTMEQIVDHIKLVENDNGSSTGLFLSGLINRFSELFAMNVDHSSLIMSSTIAVTAGSNYINLGANYLRPIDETAFYVNGTTNRYVGRRFSQNVRDNGGSPTANRTINLIGGQNYSHFSAFIMAPASETITYWYQGLQPYMSAASETPRIPSEYLIEGTRMMYKEAQGIINKRDLDTYLYQILSQANNQDNKLDRKISAFIYTDPAKATQSFRG